MSSLSLVTFLMLDSADLAVLRVAERIRLGGWLLRCAYLRTILKLAHPPAVAVLEVMYHSVHAKAPPQVRRVNWR